MALDPSKIPEEQVGTGDDTGFSLPVAVIGQDIPSELPILPMRNVAVFPGVTAPVVVGRAASVRLIEDALAGDRLVGLVGQRNKELRLRSTTSVRCIVKATGHIRTLTKR